MQTSPTAFLFNATAEGVPGYYGGPCNQALLDALEVADPTGKMSSFILRGDLLLYNLATKTVAVERTERGSSSRQSYDYGLLATVLHDLIVEIERGWHSFGPGVLLETLGRHAIHCIVLPTLPVAFREQIDEAFRRVPYYLGAMAIDLGNPIQITGFFHYLIKDAAVHDGALHLEADWEDQVNAVFDGAEMFKPNGLRIVPAGGLAELIGPLPTAELSDGGAAALSRFEGKRTFTLQERVLEALSRWWERSEKTPYSFSAQDEGAAVFDAVLPVPKLAEFLLNPNHKDNKGRAKFFQDVLGIGADDWRYLAAQIQEGLDTADVTQLNVKRWDGGSGVSFNLPITLRGLNGRSALVITNWIMREGEQPSLSTIFPGRERATEDGLAPPILTSSLKGDARWAALYEMAAAAGSEAETKAVPTPMVIKGYGAVAEGMCGWAYVHVPDGRRDFARWLLRSDLAYRTARGGATLHISGSTQSVDRAYAHAKAFARVLQHNGIECTIERYLD